MTFVTSFQSGSSLGRLRRATTLAVAAMAPLLMTACADGPDNGRAVGVEAAKSSPAVMATDVKAWMGAWVVTDLYGSGQSGVSVQPLAGQKVLLAETIATDPLGRTCTQPVYQTGSRSESVFLGLSNGDSESLTRPRPYLAVGCDQAAFAHYLMTRDGNLLYAASGRVLRLERLAEGATASRPVALAPEAKAAEPPAPAPVEAHGAAKEPEKHDANAKTGHAVYLASYRDKGNALKGWKELAHTAPLLDKAHPVFTSVNIPGQGTFLRLHAEGLSQADGARLCKTLSDMLPDCGAKNRR